MHNALKLCKRAIVGGAAASSKKIKGDRGLSHGIGQASECFHVGEVLYKLVPSQSTADRCLIIRSLSGRESGIYAATALHAVTNSLLQPQRKLIFCKQPNFFGPI